ncbi:MAG: hypothetical protein UR28_C0002G0001, partial [Candidatus Peregrinibacteria bacterium GW2011_GWF2_33_10]
LLVIPVDAGRFEESAKREKVTRERVRQMEQVALEKLRRTAERTKIHIIGEFALNIIQKKGSLLHDEDMINLIISVLRHDKNINKNAVKLAINLDRRLIKVSNTIKFYPYWRTSDLEETMIKDMSDKAEQLIGKASHGLIEVDKLCELLKGHFPKYSSQTFKSVFSIDRNLKFTDNLIGLANDERINPKTLRDKIFYILRKINKPMHFIEIANEIIKYKFDNKVINKQAVHNECIRHAGFVLIGRGIYALSEWGYKSGTVKDIIIEVLKDGKPKSREDIVSAVKKQRMVKDVTILLNLKTTEVKRVGREQYALRKV